MNTIKFNNKLTSISLYICIQFMHVSIVNILTMIIINYIQHKAILTTGLADVEEFFETGGEKYGKNVYNYWDFQKN